MSALVLLAALVRHSLTGTHVIPEQPEHRFVRRVQDLVAYDYDPATGALVGYEPLYYHAKPARVFLPNPVVTLNDPSLRDQNDAASAVPAAAYVEVELEGVNESGPLTGPFAAIRDLSAPSVAPVDASGSLLFDREQDGFEDVSAWFHIHRTQRYLQSLGYTGEKQIAPYAVPVDTHGANGADNSYFLLGTRGRGSLHFGTGGTDDAEDADLVVHEYAHALHEWIAPGTFNGEFRSEARALSEGFGDYWAFSAHYAERIASGRDPYCLADWDTRCWTDASSERCSYPPDTDCLRRVDTTRTMADYRTIDTPGTEHTNGSIWASALRELFLEVGKRAADTLVVEALFGTPPNPTFASVARRMLDVDRILFAGAHATAICTAMTARGIFGAAECGVLPRGERTFHPSSDRGVTIPDATPTGITSTLTIDDPRIIRRLYVRLDLLHSSRGDLRISLIAPNGEEVTLLSPSLDRAADIHATLGLDTATDEPLSVLHGLPAAGTWTLRITDTRIFDEGTLLSWGLVIEYGDAPLAERPRFASSVFVPAIAHAAGANGTLFTSELALFNPADEERTATLVFTRAGGAFAAVQVALRPQQVAVYEDAVRALFGTTGSGSLEIAGDVVVGARSANGGFSERVPSFVAGHAEEQILPAWIGGSELRMNVGFTEVAGEGGVVRVGANEYEIGPYEHVQFARQETGALTVAVVSGGARVVAYASFVDNRTGDATIVPAVIPPAETRVELLPAIGEDGWRTDVFMMGGEAPATFTSADGSVARGRLSGYRRDVVPGVFGETGTGVIAATMPAGVAGAARIATDGRGHSVPWLVPSSATRHLLHVENSTRRRTNLGVVASETARVRITVHDASGSELERHDVMLAPLRLAQFPVTATLTGGRATIEVLDGAVYAYASVIDRETGDPSLSW